MRTGQERRPWHQVKAEEMAQYPEVYAAYEAFLQAVRAGEHPHMQRSMITVESPDDMPAFANEDEEHEFWGVHSFGDAWYELKEPIPEDELPPVRPRSRRPHIVRNR